MQKDNKIFEDLAKLGTSAMGSMLDLKREIETIVNSQLEKVLLKMHLVTKEEFDVVQEMVAKAREENELLSERLSKLEKKLDKIAKK